MTSASARLPYASATAAAVALVIVTTALGSSSVAALARLGRPGRWLALLVLLAVAAAWAWERRRSLVVPLPVALTAAGLVALCALSTAWSVHPLLTIERAISLGLLLAAAALAAIAATSAGAAERLVEGVLVGAAVVAVGGLAVLALDHDAAVRAASVGVPARYQGLGESPNTAALLFGLTTPLAVWTALARRRLLGLTLVLAFGASIAASASRGGILAAAVGSAIVVLLCARSALNAVLLVAAVALAFVAVVAVGTLGHGTSPAASGTTTAPTRSPRYADVEQAFPLEDDVGRTLPGVADVEGSRTLLGSSGRTGVWGHVLTIAFARPVAGYGFGTEERVFQDRYANFEGGHVESSYLGLLLQLGVVGLAAFLALVAAVVAAARRALRAGGIATAAAGALTAGLVVALVQSYVYSVGNVAALTFWLSAALLAATPREVR